MCSSDLPWKHGGICNPGNERGAVRFGASKGIYAQEHRGSAGPHQGRGVLQGVFGEAGAIIVYIIAQKTGTLLIARWITMSKMEDLKNECKWSRGSRISGMAGNKKG